MNKNNHESIRISKSAVILLKGKVENVFLLFGAFEEKKWAEGWSPVLIYPSTEIIEEGTTFKTKGHGHGEPDFLWIVTKYEPEKFLIQYLVSTENRYWTITVKCSRSGENETSAEVTYTFTGLNDSGNQINEISLQNMYRENLKDWEREINHFLENN